MTSQTALEQARADLAVVEADLRVLAAAKAEAARSPASFTKWKADNDGKLAERERLIALIETMEQEAAVIESGEAGEALRKRYADRKLANEKLAQRIKADLARGNAILLALARDVAEAAADDTAINAALPDDMDPLIPADFIARGRSGLDRKELKKTRVWLWVNARGGGLIGDQDSVVDRGDGRGRIGEGAYVTNCVSALFEQTEYFPAEPAQRPESLWQMRLPQPDGPGLAFDGQRCNYPDAVLAELKRGVRINEPRERPIEIDLRPVPVAPTDDGSAAGGDVNGAA